MNGQEKEDQVFTGALSAEYWMYDSRIGRRWNIDPITYEWQSPYATFDNSPILYSDPYGLEGTVDGDPKKKPLDGKSNDFTLSEKKPKLPEQPAYLESIKLTKLPSDAVEPDLIPTYQPIKETITEVKPSFLSRVESFLDRNSLDPTVAFMLKPIYGTLDGAYTTLNWIVNRQTYNLAGRNIGRQEAEKNAVLTVGLTALGSIGSELNSLRNIRILDDVAREGKNIVGTSYDAIKPTQDWINPIKVNEYKSLLQRKKTLDPIITYENPRGIFIEDGHHRFAAYMELGLKPNMILKKTGGPVGYSNWLKTTFQIPPLGH